MAWDQERQHAPRLTIFGGMPDTNKSTVLLDIVARVTTGGLWPAGEGRAPLGSVIILSAEDGVGDTIVTRLIVAGAELRRIRVITAARGDGGKERTFDLNSDIEHLRQLIKEMGAVALVAIDPMSAYMGKPGKLDSYRNTDIRGVLAPLAKMADDCNVAVVGIDHLNKNSQAQALLRLGGSIGFAAAPRALYIVVRDKEDPDRRLFLPAKNNIARIRTGLAFKVIEKLVSLPEFDSQPAVTWEDENVTMTADEALAQAKKDGRKSDVVEAAKLLILDMLKDGPRPHKEVEAQAEAQIIGNRALRSAKESLNVRSAKRGDAWWWALPGQRFEWH
jgi:hypothetical protein